MLSLAGKPAHADEPIAFACGRASGEPALMTIVLPSGWMYEAQDQASSRVQKFVFTNARGPFPYLWAMVEQCDAERLNSLELQAAKHPRCDLLSGGTTGETYFDADRRLLWNRSKDEQGNGGVSVTLFDKHHATLKFFDQRSHLAEFEAIIAAVVDNLHLHDSVDNVLASHQAVPLPEDVDAGAFLRTGGAARFPYLLCFATLFVVSSLAAIEFRIRRARQQALIAEIENAQAEREARQSAQEEREGKAAEPYLRTPKKRVHMRRE
jgi:hypothetical protein